MRLYGFWRSLASFRVRIALNYKNLPFEEVSVDLLKGQQFDDTYKAVNPQMVVPALEDGEGPALFQSIAILEYLEDRYPTPPLLPSDARARARVRGIAQIVASDAHPLVVPRIRNYLGSEFKLDEPQRLAWIRHWIETALRAIETNLATDPHTGQFCQGDVPTLADVCLVSHVVGARLFECNVEPFPVATRIVATCLALEPFARAHPLKQPGAPAHPG